MNFLKVLGFQLDIELDCNFKNEYLIDTDKFREEFEMVNK